MYSTLFGALIVLTYFDKRRLETFLFEVDDNAKSLHENHSCQVSEIALRLFFIMRPTWNIRKRLNLTQRSILM